MRTEFLAYAAPFIGEEEIAEVVDSLRNGWLTSGPKVKAFEESFGQVVGAKHCIAVNSCTAALTLALAALDARPGDEVIVPTLTFCATANVVEHRGARPVLVDTGEDLQLCPQAVRRAISPRTRAIMAVHYGGQACDLGAILDLADAHGIPVVQDAAHAAGTEFEGRKIGGHGLVSAFSFFPSKNMTTGEGGMLATNDDAFAARLRRLSSFGISRSSRAASQAYAGWRYEVQEAGYKTNMTDLQAAIGIHQLRRLAWFIERRRDIAHAYTAAFADLDELILPRDLPGRPHAYHLYTVRVVADATCINRDSLIERLHEAKIGTSVHFIPLHRHPYYRDKYALSGTDFPTAETIFEQIFSLPLYPAMSDGDVLDVIGAVRDIVLSSREEFRPSYCKTSE